MAKKAETSTLETATQVLVRMDGMGRENARRFLLRCTEGERKKIADCHCDEMDCGREVGDRFRSELGKVMDEIIRRQEADEERKTNAG